METVNLSGEEKLNAYKAEFPQHKCVLLKDGRVAVIAEGKGKHSSKAQRLLASTKDADGEIDTDKYMSILMSMLVTIDKTKIIPEDLDEMSLSDFTKIQTAFSEVNFT